MQQGASSRFDKNIIVLVENEKVEKKKVIESILNKFVNKGDTVIAPVEHTSPTVRQYCKDNGIHYAEMSVDELGQFVLKIAYSIMFFEGPNEASYSNKYRIGMNTLGKMSIIVEVNVIEG